MQQPIDYATPRFRTSEVAAAAGMTAGTLRSYFSRKQFRVIGKKAESEGLPNLFSLRDALVFAVAAKLIDVGADPLEAFNVAVEDFGHVGTADRMPATLYDVQKHGLTFLIYWPKTGSAEIKAAKQIGNPTELLFSGMHGRQEAACMIALNFIERRVFGALGV